MVFLRRFALMDKINGFFARPYRYYKALEHIKTGLFVILRDRFLTLIFGD